MFIRFIEFLSLFRRFLRLLNVGLVAVLIGGIGYLDGFAFFRYVLI